MNLLQKLRAVAATEAKATPGPWNVVDYRHGDSSQETWLGILNGAIEIKYSALPTEENHANAALIADSRNLLPALIKLVEAQHEALEHAALVFDQYADLHMSKTPAAGDKANANRAEAEKCRAALALANQ